MRLTFLTLAKVSRFLNRIKNKNRPLVFGMIHVPALPGTPRSTLSVPKIMEKVQQETEIYAQAQVDGIILENMHDIPYITHEKIGPEITANMTRACLTCTQILGSSREKFLLGVQILAGANFQALAVAQAAEFDFIRAECYVFAHIADEGLMNGCSGDLLRYRKSIGAEDVAVLTDIKKKHSSHAITSDLSIGEVAHASEFFLADGVIVTGFCTGKAASPEDVKAVKDSCRLPVIVGSGVDEKNSKNFTNADAFIVGSYFKKGGYWENELDPVRVSQFMQRIRSLGGQKSEL